MRVLSKIGSVLLFAALVAGTAQADERDRLTYLTFSGPVQLPGVTLSAGTYTFRLADPEGDRHVIQVLNRQNGKLITTLMTIPNMALDAPKDAYAMFEERPAGSPPAMKAWFYPGNSIGEEFIYPKKQAVAIAKAIHKPVLATDAESTNTAAFKTGKVARVDENGNVVNDQTASAPPPQGSTPAQSTNSSTSGSAARSDSSPAAPGSQSGGTPPVGTSGQTSRNEPTSRTTNTSTSGARRSELPQTASSIVVIQALSGLSLAGAFGLRWLRKGLSM
jgi:hypothetical protein